MSKIITIVDELISEAEKYRAENQVSAIDKVSQRILSSILFSTTVNAYLIECFHHTLDYCNVYDASTELLTSKLKETHSKYFKTDLFAYIHDYMVSKMDTVKEFKEKLHTTYSPYLVLVVHVSNLLIKHPNLIKYIYQFYYLGESSTVLKEIFASYLSDNHEILDVCSALKKELFSDTITTDKVDPISKFSTMWSAFIKIVTKVYATLITEYKKNDFNKINILIYEVIIKTIEFLLSDIILQEHFKKYLYDIDDKLKNINLSPILLSIKAQVMMIVELVPDIKSSLSIVQIRLLNVLLDFIKAHPTLINDICSELMTDTSIVPSIVEKYYHTLDDKEDDKEDDKKDDKEDDKEDDKKDAKELFVELINHIVDLVMNKLSQMK